MSHETSSAKHALLVSQLKNSGPDLVLTSKTLATLRKDRVYFAASKKVLYRVGCDDQLVFCSKCESVAYVEALRVLNLECGRCVVCHSDQLDLM